MEKKKYAIVNFRGNYITAFLFNKDDNKIDRTMPVGTIVEVVRQRHNGTSVIVPTNKLTKSRYARALQVVHTNQLTPLNY